VAAHYDIAVERVSQAKAWVSAAIAAAGRFGVGHGHGPIHHFHEIY
jgi:hydroxymethylpyrimidine/phosphomethylpyrimidine kinase